MSNHPNRGWRARWTIQSASRVAVHVSGLTARVEVSPTDPSKDQLKFDEVRAVDQSKWEIGRLTQEAGVLWSEVRADFESATGLRWLPSKGGQNMSENARRASMLREGRERLGLTQSQLGVLLEVSANTIARRERGELPVRAEAIYALEAISETKRKRL